jgi:hypothetical protein
MAVANVRRRGMGSPEPLLLQQRPQFVDEFAEP